MAELRRRYVRRLTDSQVREILNREREGEEDDFFVRSEATDELLHVSRKSDGSINVVFYNSFTFNMCYEDYDKLGRWIRRGTLA